MIDAMDLYRTLHRKPFQPFRVRLRDGSSVDIQFEHLAVVGKTFLDYGVPETNPDDPTWPIAESIERIDLNDIVRVEPLASASPSGVN